MASLPVTARYRDALEAIRTRSQYAAGVVWDELDSYSDAGVNAYLDQVVPLIGGAQSTAVVLTDAYMASAMRRRPLGVDVAGLTGPAVRSGTTPEQVYTRPFITVWTSLSEGRTPQEAIAAGRARVLMAVATDVALSTRAAASEIGKADPNIDGLMRAVSGGGCQFCAEFAGEEYATDELMPLHPNCGCTLEPVSGGVAQGGGTGEERPQAPEDTKAAVHEHGELGPILADASDNFTEADEIAA